MAQRITILQGHPDPRGGHFCDALADAYAEGARAAGREVRRLEIAKLDFPLLRSAEDFYQGAAPEAIRSSQEAIAWADHLLIVYPLWYGHFPAVLHAFLEQTFRPNFAVDRGAIRGMPKKRLKGKSARIVVTMGMPGWFYRWWYGAHSLKSLKHNILRFSGIKPVRATLIGLLGAGAKIEAVEREYPLVKGAAARARWLDRLRALGRQGE